MAEREREKDPGSNNFKKDTEWSETSSNPQNDVKLSLTTRNCNLNEDMTEYNMW